MLPKPVYSVIDASDIVIEVVDARDVKGTRSAALEELVKRKEKKLVILVNKVDLARPVGYPRTAVLFSARERKGTKRLRAVLHSFYPDKEEIKVGVVGYANTGKSMVINAMGGHAITGHRPGVTRGEQWFKISGRMMMLDTPGVIPTLEEGASALVLKGSYDVTKLKDPIDPAIKLIESLGGKRLKKAYEVELFDDAYEQLDELAGKWMMLLKGGELNLDRAAKKLLLDWQKGKIK